MGPESHLQCVDDIIPYNLHGLTADHSDPTGLYSYKNQPSRVLFALDSLASSLLPILGYEAKNGSAPSDGWGAAASKDDVRAWDEAGLAAIEGWNEVFNNTLKKEESSAWAKVSHYCLSHAHATALRTEDSAVLRRARHCP